MTRYTKSLFLILILLAFPCFLTSQEKERVASEDFVAQPAQQFHDILFRLHGGESLFSISESNLFKYKESAIDVSDVYITNFVGSFGYAYGVSDIFTPFVSLDYLLYGKVDAYYFNGNPMESVTSRGIVDFSFGLSLRLPHSITNGWVLEAASAFDYLVPGADSGSTKSGRHTIRGSILIGKSMKRWSVILEGTAGQILSGESNNGTEYGASYGLGGGYTVQWRSNFISIAGGIAFVYASTSKSTLADETNITLDPLSTIASLLELRFTIDDDAYLSISHVYSLKSNGKLRVEGFDPLDYKLFRGHSININATFLIL